MFLIAIAFLVGHCVVHAAPSLPPTYLLAVPIGAITFCFVLRFCGSAFGCNWQAHPLIRQTLSCLSALFLGVVFAWGHAAWRLADSFFSQTISVDAEVQGRIDSMVDVDEGSVGFWFAVDSSDPKVPSRLDITWYDTTERPTPGERWQLRVRLKAPRGFANPGGADYTAQLFRNGIAASGYVRDTKRDAGRNVRLQPANSHALILRTRASLANKLATALPHSKMLGIVQGLAVGDTQEITSDQWRVFANTGTTHLMAISGLHIGMVAALFFWLAGRLARRLPLQRFSVAASDIQSIAGIVAATGYSALAGFSVPTQRTLVMLLVYFGTRLLRRQVAVTRGLSIALIGVLIVDPFAPLAPGFWLSFGAVSAIFLATAGRIKRPAWFPEYLQLQGAVTVGLLPLLIGAFGSVSIISPLVNLVAIPFFTFVIVPIVLTATLLLPISESLGGLVAQLAAQLLTWSWPALEWASDLPMATWHLPQLPIAIAVLMILGCAIVIGPGISATRLAGAMLCLPALLWQPSRPRDGEYELTILDVGQGLAVVVITKTHVLVYDAGPSFRSGRDTGEMVVAPYLYSRGIRAIDTLMISHGDNDHAGGASTLHSTLRTRQVLAGPSVAMSLPVTMCQQGQQWQWDQVRFSVLHPAIGVSLNKRQENNSSCVLRIDGTSGSALLLGDIEREAEENLVTNGSINHADVVVVPHHGSRTSSTQVLTEATAPRLAIISAGFGNRWGFPKEDVLERWHSVGAHTLNTATSGAIEIAIERAGIRVSQYRQVHRAYWHP